MTEYQTNQQSLQQQPRFELSQQVQAELATLNVRYRDMQETMSRLITMLAAENAELKTENATLKNQLASLQTQNNTETSNKK
jgi:regulator of replication initiation timing